MEMTYGGALVMPSNYAVMSEEEMTYVEGGGYELAVNKGYLNKNTCLGVAERFVKLTGMTLMRIAKEIYAHAVMYYASSSSLPSWSQTIAAQIGGGYSNVYTCLAWIKERSNPINIGDDNIFRVAVYNAIWLNS